MRAMTTSPANPSNGPMPTTHNNNVHGMRFMDPKLHMQSPQFDTFGFVVSNGAWIASTRGSGRVPLDPWLP
jgi:hypothetical protein